MDESYEKVLSYVAVCISVFYIIKFGISLLTLAVLGNERVIGLMLRH